jgi:MFS family permease
MLAGLSPGVATLLVFYGIAGAGNGLENVACDTLIGSTAEPSKLGRVLGTVYGPIFLASNLAAVAGAALVGRTPPRVVFLAAGCGVLFVLLPVRKMLPALPEEPRAAERASKDLLLCQDPRASDRLVRLYKRPAGSTLHADEK